MLEGFARGDYGGIDIVRAGGVDGYDFGFIAGEMLDLDELAGGSWAIRGVNGGDLLAVAALHPFVVDEETRWLSVFPAIGSRKIDMKVCHLE